MGYLYYGHYAHYYEIGRVELLRYLGMSYRDMEDVHKVMLPVKSVQMRFLRPAYYDDVITVKTTLKQFIGSSLFFHTELFNEKGKLMNTGEVVLVCVDATTMRKCPPPKQFVELLAAKGFEYETIPPKSE